MADSLKLNLLILSLLLVAGGASAQDMPHDNLEFECEVCHSLKEWSGVRFDHADSTGFVLEGRHGDAECRGCHTLKDFAIIDTKCVSCHKDIHEGKLGPECDRCHTSDGFTVFNVEDIHAETNFPLMGRHALADCQSCHTGLPIGDLSFNTTRCVGCHQQDYLEVTSPNHVAAGFPTDCDDCHQMSSWRPAILTEHDVFFPIFSGEHAGEWDDCSTCHIEPGNFQVFSCFGCHEHNRADTDENHQGIPGYVYNSQDCLICHPTGEAGAFVDHDALYFPIFSGNHDGVWDACSDCHDNPANRTEFNCLACHTQTTTDNIHQGIGGYDYVSTACFACHPDGSGIEFTEHDGAYFPIYSGTHNGVWNECSDCHTDPANRSVFSCLTCHEQTETGTIHTGMPSYAYESSACLTCHPTGSGGDFEEHDALFFPIYTGNHAGAWDDCSECHTDPSDRSVFSCTACHTQAETNPIHSGITSYVYESSACYTCHPTGESGDFLEHDALFFPIYSGTHDGTWGDCITCHINPVDRSEFSCLSCHDQSTTDNIHAGLSSYVYNSQDCFSCHPDGEEGEFTEHLTYFPIYTGPHTAVWAECTDCHPVPADRTIFDCLPCHEQSATDLIHTGMPGYSYISPYCFDCHPTGERWDYVDHDATEFPIFSGTHVGVWTFCSECHYIPTDRTQFDCLVCHEQGTVDPVHSGMPSYSYESSVCYSCHPNGVIEDYLEHDTYFFPIYTGGHSNRWTTCATCHIDPADRSVFSCTTGCHPQGGTDAKHDPVTVPDYVYDSYECYNCHPTGEYP